MSATAAGTLLRRRRTLAAAAIGLLAVPGTVVMAVVAVAMGTTPPAAELAANLGIPPIALDAYRHATTAAPTECDLRWQILAGIGQAESNHATGHIIAADGTVTPAIVGPPLDGSAGRARILDSDDGTLDGDTSFDRAVGPLQFLPASWRRFGVDSNDDGAADPNNFYDAAAAAAAHLCASAAGPLSDDPALEDALFAYNRSDTYVQAVLDWIHRYDTAAAADGPATASGSTVTVAGISVDASIAEPLADLLAAAVNAGIDLSGAGYRSRDEQVALRRAHCGTTHYALYEMPPSACTPPTARPGESLHEQGLAIDFTCDGVLMTRRDRCFAFLAAYASRYGLSNLPSEPWHWSTTGG